MLLERVSESVQKVDEMGFLCLFFGPGLDIFCHVLRMGVFPSRGNKTPWFSLNWGPKVPCVTRVTGRTGKAELKDHTYVWSLDRARKKGGFFKNTGGDTPYRCV